MPGRPVKYAHVESEFQKNAFDTVWKCPHLLTENICGFYSKTTEKKKMD